MALLVHPQSELIREPRLLVPRQQPLGPVKVNWAHPLTSRLAAYFHFTSQGAVDLVSNQKMTVSGSPSTVVTPKGQMVRLVKETPDYFTANVSLWSGASCCIEWFGKITALDSNGAMLVQYGSTYWQFAASNVVYIAGLYVVTSGFDVNGDYHHGVMGGVVDDANQRFWLDGNDITTSGQDAKQAVAAGTKLIYVGKSPTGTSWDLSADLAYVRLWNGLSKAEILSLKEDPYQFLTVA
jgi:hypothetical protein